VSIAARAQCACSATAARLSEMATRAVSIRCAVDTLRMETCTA
jgi:hypothetical protein